MEMLPARDMMTLLQLRRRVITPAVNELKDKGYFPDLKVKEEKGDSGNKVIALLFKF